MPGVVAKLVGDPETGELSIRFFTLKENPDTTFTYDDGQTEVDLEMDLALTLTGEDAELQIVPTGLTYTDLIGGYTSVSSNETIGGFIGLHTDASVIATEGIAIYYGDAIVETFNSGDGEGLSALGVDFGSGTADLFTEITSGTIVTFDEMQALNMKIDGYTFTGDEVLLFLEGAPVSLASVTGDSTNAAAAGMFFGPADFEGVPAEYGAVAIISGDDDKVVLLSSGAAVP